MRAPPRCSAAYLPSMVEGGGPDKHGPVMGPTYGLFTDELAGVCCSCCIVAGEKMFYFYVHEVTNSVDFAS